MTLKCCIIDDEPLARELIKSYVEKTPFMELEGSYESATAAIKSILSGTLDVVFLDINMPCLNGIEFAEIIPKTTRIIYVTAYEQYALQGFRAGALDYLLKPVNYPEFLKAVQKATEWKAMHCALLAQGMGNINHIVIKSDYKLVQIPLDDIIYIEGQKDYVKFFLNREPYTITSLLNLKNLETALPSERFLRVHRSFIINTDKITTIDRNRVVFGKTYIPISETYKNSFYDFIRRRSISGTIEQEEQ